MSRERIAVKRGFQRYRNPLSSKQALMYPDHDVDVMASTFRLMGTGVTLTAADKCVLMEPQHMPPTETQGKRRVWRISQEREVRIVRLVCVDIAVEKDVVNLGKLREHLSNATMRLAAGDEGQGDSGDLEMVDEGV